MNTKQSQLTKAERKQRSKEFIAHLRLEDIHLDPSTKKLFDDFDNSLIAPEKALDDFYTVCNKEFNANVKKPETKT